VASLQDLSDPDYDPFAAEKFSNPVVSQVLVNLGKTAYSAVTAPGDALAGKLDPLSDEGARRVLDLAGFVTGGAGVVPAEAGALRAGIKAYHGSPHDFDQFDLSKIGTGEGAQAYGHGLYFAENEGTARAYRNNLSDAGNARVTGGLSPKEEFVFDRISQGASDLDVLKDFASRYGGSFDDAMAAVDKVKSLNKGKMYEVSIAADPEHFLDWDKPLSEQHPAIREKFSKAVLPGNAEDDQLLRDLYGHDAGPKVLGLFDKSKGSQAYNTFQSQVGDPNRATEMLRQAGIPGIKYLDQGSRPPRSLADTQQSIKYYSDMLAKEPNNQFAADQLKQYQGDLKKYDQGSHNYVVFDDKIVNIVKKYGLAGLSLLPPAIGAELSKQVKEVDHDPFEGAVKSKATGQWHKVTPVDHNPFEGT
jgi:hypothetical protein